MAKARTRDDLVQSAGLAGFSPARTDVPGLLDLLGSADASAARNAVRALGRLGPNAIDIARTAYDAATGPLRARLCELVARVGAANAETTADAVRWLGPRLTDADPRVRRRAARAIGQLGGPEGLAMLLAAWNAERDPSVRRVLAEALGKTGDAAALDALTHDAHEEPEFLGRTVRQAVQRVERTLLRGGDPTVLDPSVRPVRPVPVLLHVRAGLEDVLLDELDEDCGGEPVAPGRVGIRLNTAPERLWRRRTFLHFGFPLAPVTVRTSREQAAEAAAEAVIQILTGPEAMTIFETWTRGPIRYRIDWANAGHRRATTLDVAEGVRQARPNLINDPVDAPWEAVVSERRGSQGLKVSVELWPSGLRDPRFAYRVKTTPSATQPTLAAAMVRLGGAEPNDVVWDPFVGSGLELCERGLAGPHQALIGTDIDASAIEAARANLDAAGLDRAELAVADSREFRPSVPVTLVLTNPPFARRNPVAGGRDPLLEAVLSNIAICLAAGGRCVFVSPAPTFTLGVAERIGLRLERKQRVDVGGFTAELQVFRQAGTGQVRTTEHGQRP